MVAIRKKIFENLHLKLLSLLFALILYLMVSLGEGQDVVETTRTLKLQQLGDPKGLVMVGTLPREIEIRVKGRQRGVDQIDEMRLVYNIDVSSFTEPGVHPYRVSKGQIEGMLPRGVTVTAIDPSQISLEFERLVPMEVAVRISDVGEPAKGFEVVREGMIPTPKTVRVEGPELSLEGLLFIPTEPIDMSGRTSSFLTDVALDTANRPFHVVDEGPIRVQIEIRPIISERVFEGVRIEVVNTDKQAEVRPETLDVKITGPAVDLARLSPESVRLIIDASGMDDGTRRVRPTLEKIQPPANAAGDLVGPAELPEVRLTLRK